MCTSLSLPTVGGHRLFGRTLDLDAHFGERVVLTPGGSKLERSGSPPVPLDYPLLGMAAVEEDYPLYAEAMNGAGLCMAGLRFAESARYADCIEAGKRGIAPWELIPYLLGRCATVEEARMALGEIQLVSIDFSRRIPVTPLHWHIADADAAHGELVVESTAEGLRVYDNPFGVLTNEPPFPEQTAHLPLTEIPGGYDSAARFARGAILRRRVADWIAGEGKDTGDSGDLFFRILGAVAPMAGVVMTPQGRAHRTLYTCCMDGAAGIYRYFTEEDSAIRSVKIPK